MSTNISHAQWGARPFPSNIILKDLGDLVEGNGRILDLRENLSVTFDSLTGTYHLTTEGAFTADSLNLTGTATATKFVGDGVASKPATSFTVCSSTSTAKDACDYTCDNVADEVQVEAALAALPATGGKISLLDGVFTFASPATITQEGVTIEGLGINSTTIYMADGAESDMFEINLSSGGNFFTLRGFTARGNDDNNSAGSFLYDSVGAGDMGDITLEELFITQFAEEAVDLDYAARLLINKCNISDNSSDGVVMSAGGDWKILNSKLAQNVGHGLNVDGSTSTDGILANCLLGGGANKGGVTMDSTRVVISNNIFEDSANSPNFGLGFSANGDGNLVIGNFIRDGGGDMTPGIYIGSGATGNHIMLNKITMDNGTRIVDSGTNTQFIDYRGTFGRDLYLDADTVGIGTTDTTERLNVEGNLYFSSKGETITVTDADDRFIFEADGSSGAADAESVSFDMATQGETTFTSSNGTIYHDRFSRFTGHTRHNDFSQLQMGTGGDVKISYEGSDRVPTLQIGIAGYSNYNNSGMMALMEDSDVGHDNRVPADNNGQPTLRWWKTGTTANTEWFDIYFDNDAQLKTGIGDIILSPASEAVYVNGGFTTDSLIVNDNVVGDLDITGNLSVGDISSDERLNVYGNIQMYDGDVIDNITLDDSFIFTSDGSGTADAESFYINMVNADMTKISTTNPVIKFDSKVEFTVDDAAVIFDDEAMVHFGSFPDSFFEWNTQGSDGLQLALKAGGSFADGRFTLTDFTNYDHANRNPDNEDTEPTLRIYRSGNTSADDWMDLNMDGNGNIETGAGDIDLAAGSGNTNIIGTGTLTGNLVLQNGETLVNATDDVFYFQTDGSSAADAEWVVFDMDVDGQTHVSTSNATWYQDRYTRFTVGTRHDDDGYMQFGSSGDNTFIFETEGNDNWQLAVRGYSSSYSGYLSLLENGDKGHANRSPSAASAHPTFRIYTDGTASVNDHIEFYHDNADGIIATGADDIKLMPASGVVEVAGSDEQVCGITNGDCIDFDDGSDGEITLKGVGGTNNHSLKFDMEMSGDSVMLSSSTEYITIGDGETASQTSFDSLGFMTMAGEARVTVDLYITASGVKAPGANPAAFVEYGLTGAWEFDDQNVEGNQESISGTLKLPTQMDKSVAPVFKVGWSANGVSPGICEWQLEYLYLAPGEDTTAVAQETLDTSTSGIASSTSEGLVITAFSGMDLPSATDQAMLFKITRLSAGGDDTIADTVELRGMLFMHTRNTLGTGL